MPKTDRDLFQQWWSEARDEGVWAAAWPRLVDGLTAAQAAWQPPGRDGSPRHSVWQIVEHMIFWRENVLGRLDGGHQPTEAELAARNFPRPEGEPTEAAWADARRRLAETHERVAAAVRDRGEAAAVAMSFLPHDAYHMGQIAYVRALLGLGPVA